MGFNAADYNADWDFGEIGSGTIPEPSGDAVERFREEIKRALKARDLDAQVAAVIELCGTGGGAPTREQILGLPDPRLREAFVGWVVGMFARSVASWLE